MSGFSGGVLRYAILIEAVDKATGRLNQIMNQAQRTQRALSFPETGASNMIRGQIDMYAKLTQVSNAYSATLSKSLRGSGKGFLADIYDAQKKDADKQLGNIETFARKATSLLSGVNQKTLGSLRPDIAKGRAESRDLSQQLFDHKKWKASEPQRKQISQEITKFFNDISSKTPWADKKAGSNFVDVWLRELNKMSPVARKMAQQGLEGALGMSLSQVQNLSETDRAMLKHQTELAAVKNRVLETADAYGKMNQKIDSLKSQVKGLSILWVQAGQAMSQAMSVTRPLADAMAFSNMNIQGRTPFSYTNLGATITDVGGFYKSAARSPYEREMFNAQGGILNYSKLFNADAANFIPVLSGMQTLFGNETSMNQKVSALTGAGMKSNLDFAGWFTLYMQGAVPQMAALENDLNETLSLIGSVSNQGLGAFAGFGISGALQNMIKPSKKSQELQASYGMDLSSIIQNNGILDALELINAEFDKMTKPERVKAMAEIFPGMGTGVVEVMLKSVQQAKAMNREMSSMLEVNRAINEASEHGYYRLQQLSSSWNNVMTGILYNLSDTSIFKGFVKTLDDVASGMNKMNDASMGKRSFGKEIMAGAPVLGGTLMGGFTIASMLQFMPKYLNAAFMANQASQTQALLTQGFSQQQIKGMLPGKPGFLGFAAGKGGSAIGGALAGVAILTSIYAVVSTISNAVKDYHRQRNKERFVDPIVALSTADFDGARKGNQESLEKLNYTLGKAIDAINLNTKTVGRSGRVARAFDDYNARKSVLEHFGGDAL